MRLARRSVLTAVCPSLVRTQFFSAHRNRPAELSDGAPESDAEQRRIDAITEGVQTPDDIAAAMLEGVRANRLWVFPNRERLTAIRQRFAAVLD